MDNLSALREQIDDIDASVISLLKKRMEVVCLVGRLKKEQGLPFRDEKRWRESLEKKCAQAKTLGLDPELIKKIYAPVHKHALRIEGEA